MSDINGFGRLSKLAGRKVTTSLYEDITTGAAIGHLLDAAGFPSHLRDLDTGVVLPHWWYDGPVLTGLEYLVKGTTAEIYERGDGAIVFRSQSSRGVVDE